MPVRVSWVDSGRGQFSSSISKNSLKQCHSIREGGHVGFRYGTGEKESE